MRRKLFQSAKNPISEFDRLARNWIMNKSAVFDQIDKKGRKTELFKRIHNIFDNMCHTKFCLQISK